MHRLIFAALLVVCACAKPEPTRLTYRDAGQGLYSNAVFERNRLAGHWTQVAAFAPANGPHCPPGEAQFTPQGEAMQLAATLCLGGEEVRYSGPISFPQTGRMLLSGADPAGIGQPWWVLWVDTDYRTLVIGTPSGSFGFILNRDDRLPGDRLAAARDILDWGGYDLSKLHLFN